MNIETETDGGRDRGENYTFYFDVNRIKKNCIDCHI